MKLDSIDTSSLAERVAGKIEELIINNQLKPGDKLANEMELVTQLGVGRGTIREAVKILESRNVVEIRRGKGTYVCDNTGVTGDPLGFRFAHNKRKLAEDLSDLRCMIEPPIAAITAEKATDQEIEELQIICSEVERLIKVGEDYSQQDIDFHVKIASMSGNLVVPQIIPLITQGISLYVNLTEHHLAGTAAITHQKVVDAIKKHDSSAAYDAMLEHMRENRNSLEMLK